MKEAEPGLTPGSALNLPEKFGAEFDLRAFFFEPNGLQSIYCSAVAMPHTPSWAFPP
jgi:hypothetical protein